MGTVPTVELKEPKGIVDYAHVATELVAKIDVATTHIDSIVQIAAVSQASAPSPPTAPTWREHNSVFPNSSGGPSNTLHDARWSTQQMAPIRPLVPDDTRGVDYVNNINVTYRGNGRQGNLGIGIPITPSALGHILQSLPSLNAQDPNVDFWIKLKDAVITFAMEYTEVVTVIKAKAPVGYSARLNAAAWPRAMPSTDETWEMYLTECTNIAQEVLGRGHHSFSLLTTCVQGPKESFSDFSTRFEEKHRILSACCPDTPTINSSFIIDTAAKNMNEKYRQTWAIGLPVTADWSAFLCWGQRAETHMIQFSEKPTIAAVQDAPVGCTKCGKLGHFVKHCRSRSANGPHTSPYKPTQVNDDRSDATAEMLHLLRNLAKANLNEQ